MQTLSLGISLFLEKEAVAKIAAKDVDAAAKEENRGMLQEPSSG